MKIVADESIDRQIVDRLRGDGHEVVFIAESSPGISDDEVLRRSVEAEALLLTADKDFGELIYRQHLFARSVVLIRLPGLRTELKAEIVGASFKRHGSEMDSAFTVITEKAVRLRPFQSGPLM